MDERLVIHEKARDFFDDVWRDGDFWRLETSEFEREKYASQMNLLGDRRYGRALEIGCGSGCFSRLLAGIADEVVALDVSPLAVERARALSTGWETIDFRVANIMEYDPAGEGPWDLIVMSETIYYLGWLYSFFDVAWLAVKLYNATHEGGRLLMANTCGGVEDYLLYPPIIRTYHDLMLNVGYQLDEENVFHGSKDGHEHELTVLVSLYGKDPSFGRNG
jgi:SAM-dependent methyltransferase